MEEEGYRMKEVFYVETYCGSKCNVTFEVIAKKEGRVLVKSWDCYKELVKMENGKNFWAVDREYNEIPDEWKS
jgi:hypothetical protein